MERLFVYGTLQPGRSNAYLLEEIGGNWQEAFVNGHFYDSGWGAAEGFPGLVLDPDGPQVNGYVFTSANLVQHWSELDAFEDGYDRVMTQVVTSGGASLRVWVYQLQAKR